jgi:hypothetical protein
MFQDFFVVEIIMNEFQNVLVKTQNHNVHVLYYHTGGLVVKLGVYRAVSNACTGSNPAWTNFFPTCFSLPVMQGMVVDIIILLRFK